MINCWNEMDIGIDGSGPKNVELVPSRANSFAF